MATLVLTTVGSLVGGPIGGAIGAAIGNGIDQRLLGRRRQGPRLGDLSVQTSSYGSAIPRVFGTIRVAGTVIWATDLREDRHRSGGKGGKTTTYSYSAGLAVALSARPILGVRRIWADGKPLRGAGGDWTAETRFRLYLGGEDQPADPLIAAAEGIAATPAHRGIAYAVFEDLQLADFGNRIPSLSFEVVADTGAVAIDAIAAALAEGVLAATGDGPALTGFAASGDSVRGAIEALAAAWPLPLADDGAVLRIGDPAAAVVDESELGTAAGTGRQPIRARDRRAAAALPDEVAIGYYEPARDYQAGLQRARRDGIGARAERIELPAAAEAATAKGLAEAALAQAWAARAQATLHLPWRRLGLRAGTTVMLGGTAHRVRGWTLEGMALRLTLVPLRPAPRAVAASPGRATGGDVAAAGTTVLQLVDLPAPGDGDAAAPQLFVAAAGTAAGWRRAELSLSLDDGASWQPVGRTALPAVMGTMRSVLPPGPPELLDMAATVEVALLHDAMALAGADRAALVAGANLALVGEELIQFGMAEQIGPARWRLGTLLRGRRGTDRAIGGHDADERFLLIEAATLRPLDVPLAAIGAVARVRGSGPGDGAAEASASLAVTGAAVRPPAPVRLRAARAADGAITVGWTRRSRIGWTWLDGGDAPVGEDGERYRLELRAGAAGRVVELAAPGFTYTAEAQATDGIAPGPLAITARVVQLGTRAASWPAAATWMI